MEEQTPLHLPDTQDLEVPTQTSTPEKHQAPSTNLFREGVELVKSLVWVLVAITVIRNFVFQPYDVRGASMEPTLTEHDYLIADKFSYRIGNPSRGDVVVLYYPRDPSKHYVKRVIGLPGETIVITDGSVFVKASDGTRTKLEEPYLGDQVITTVYGDAESHEYPVPENAYFVLGDNRGNSSDSREWGYLPKQNIAGIVRLRAYPFPKFGTIGHGKD